MFGPEVIALLAGAAVCMLLMGDFNWWSDDPPRKRKHKSRDEDD